MRDIDYLNTFKYYVALKQHFNIENNYEFKGIKNLHKLSLEALLKRKDKSYFIKMTQKYSPDEYEYLLSMFLKDPNMWIGEMFERKNYEFHQSRMGKISQLKYIVISELHEIIETSKKPLVKLLDDNYNIPDIAKNKRVSLETLAVVNKVINFTKEETLNPLWNINRQHINNYSKLLYVDDDLHSKILGVL